MICSVTYAEAAPDGAPCTSSMRYAFVLNPAARNGRAARLWAELEKLSRAAGLDFTLRETEARGHGIELARQAAQSHDVVVAVGGDGTVQEVMRGVVGSEAVMGIIPAGTGNDFAQAIGMPKGLDEALSAMLKADTVAVDVGRIRWQEKGDDGLLTEHEGAFTNCAGTGFDAAAAKATHRYKALGGRLSYVAAVLETLWKWRKPEVEVEIWASGFEDGGDGAVGDGREPGGRGMTSKTANPKAQSPKPIHTGQFFLIEIDNGFSVGGGFLLTPNAQIDDGLFDVCFVEHLTTRRALQLMPKTFSGAHVGEPEVRLFQARSVRINSTAPLPVQADGEILTACAVSLDVEIVPGALRIRAPQLRRPVGTA